MPLRSALFLMVVAALPVAAHHAFAAEFDVNQPFKVKGTVTKVEWVNPHAWIYVDVKEADGKVTNWHFELGPPNALFRLGWKKDAIPVGSEVEVSGFRAKSGETVGNGRSIILADGKELFSGGSAPGAEPPEKSSLPSARIIERPFPTVSPLFARKPETSTSDPTGMASFFQPSRNRAFGGPSSKCQLVTLPSASFTST